MKNDENMKKDEKRISRRSFLKAAPAVGVSAVSATLHQDANASPLEVVQAGRWAEKNKDLKGDALTAALEKENWDPSVKSLVNFPQVLGMMNEKLDWTQKLGDAFLAQQKEVMDTVQKLRAKAEAEGNLKTTKEQKVVVEKETQIIVIESASPKVVYVPTYNPTVVYGA